MVPKDMQYEVLLIHHTEHAINNVSQYTINENPSGPFFQETNEEEHYQKLLSTVFNHKNNLPGITSCELKLMQLRTSENLLSFEMAQGVTSLDFSKSIDPFYFLELQEYN